MKAFTWLVLSMLVLVAGTGFLGPLSVSATPDSMQSGRIAPAPPAQPPAAAEQQAETCALPYQPVSRPLTDLGNDIYVRMDGQETGFRGGLYPDGSNSPPPEHLEAGLALAAGIQPLDAAGRPDPQRGRIAILSIGMSNTNSEFNQFIQLVRRTPGTNARLILVNGAQPNRTAEQWTDPQAPPWLEVENRLGRVNLTPAQVQVVWIKQTHRRGGPFPETAQLLQSDLEAIVRNLPARFPQLKLVFLSSRTRSYNIERGLSPEPSAFETGFAVKWLIEKQISGDPALNYDPARGEVTAPFLAWGPYLWIDGETPRADGQVWPAVDLRRDCTHPTSSGVAKVSQMLLDFFTTDPLARGWFLQPESTPTAAPLPSATPALTATLRPTPTHLPTGYRATALSELRPTRKAGSPTAVTQTEQAGLLAPAGTGVRSLPARRLAPLGLAFVILLCLGGAGGVWYLLRRRR